jgi:hypothetical protein
MVAWNIRQEVALSAVTVDDLNGGVVAAEAEVFQEPVERHADRLYLLFKVGLGILGRYAFLGLFEAVGEDLFAGVLIRVIGIDVDGR